MSDYMKKLISGEVLAETNGSLDELQKEALNEVLEESNGKVEKWEPKEWRPEYQVIVTLSLMNFDNVQISEIMESKYNYSITKQHVSNILNSERGREIKKEYLGTVIEKTKQTVEDNLEKMEELAAQRIVEVLERKELVQSDPFALIDRSVKILEGRSKLKRESGHGGTNNQQNNFFNLPPEIASRIDQGLKKSAIVEELHGPDKRSNEPEKRSGTDG